MTEFTLPKNSVVKSGKTVDASQGRKSPKRSAFTALIQIQEITLALILIPLTLINVGRWFLIHLFD